MNSDVDDDGADDGDNVQSVNSDVDDSGVNDGDNVTVSEQ